MKKIVLAALCAISLMALNQQQASAWVNSKFGIGLNWDLQSGGNQFGWGLWRNGQPPGPEAFGGGGGGHGHGHSYGAAMQPSFAPAPQGFAPMPQPYPMQGSFDGSSLQPYAVQNSSPYQFANYPRPAYYYPQPVYYYYSR